MKTYTFKNETKNTNNYSFHNIDYSKILDDIILTDIVKKNNYLFTKAHFGTSNTYNDDFIKASNFLANYKKNTKKPNIPYIIGKMYTLNDGTRIVFYDDEIQIGFDCYSYSDFSDFSFLNSLSEGTKKIIINIYANGNDKININIK